MGDRTGADSVGIGGTQNSDDKVCVTHDTGCGRDVDVRESRGVGKVVLVSGWVWLVLSRKGVVLENMSLYIINRTSLPHPQDHWTYIQQDTSTQVQTKTGTPPSTQLHN